MIALVAAITAALCLLTATATALVLLSLAVALPALLWHATRDVLGIVAAPAAQAERSPVAAVARALRGVRT